MLFGPRSRWIDLWYSPNRSFILINLELGGLFRLIGKAAEASANTAMPLRDIGLGELETAVYFYQLAMECVTDEIKAASLAFQELDRILGEKLSLGDHVDCQGRNGLLDRLYGARHTTKVNTLAEALGLSKSGFNRLTQRELGLSSKEFLCISRAKRFLVSLITANPRAGRKNIDRLLDVDYYDQAHAIHDINDRAGISPGLITRRVRDAEECGFFLRWR